MRICLPLILTQALYFSAGASAATLLVGSGGIDKYSDTGTFQGQFVAPGSGGLGGLGGFSFGPGHILYAASHDTGSILEYDDATGAFIGTLVAGLNGPENIAFSLLNGNAYISADSGFYILDTTTAHLSSVPAGQSYGGAFRPSNGDFLLSDYSGGINGTGTVVEYTLDGVLVGPYATTGFNDPTGLAVGPDGRVYATNVNDGTLSVVPLAGGAASTFASGFSVPRNLAWSAGNLYFTDYNLSTIFVLDGTGTVVNSFSGPPHANGIAFAPAVASIHEPATLSLLALGLAAGCVRCGWGRRRRPGQTTAH